MIVAFGATHREAKKSLGGVLDRVFHPLLATEHLVIAAEVAGGAQGVRVVRRGLVRGEHFQDHPVVTLVLVQRLHDPLARAPDVRLAVPYLVASAPRGPTAVAPAA